MSHADEEQRIGDEAAALRARGALGQRDDPGETFVEAGMTGVNNAS